MKKHKLHIFLSLSAFLLTANNQLSAMGLFSGVSDSLKQQLKAVEELNKLAPGLQIKLGEMAAIQKNLELLQDKKSEMHNLEQNMQYRAQSSEQSVKQEARRVLQELAGARQAVEQGIRHAGDALQQTIDTAQREISQRKAMATQEITGKRIEEVRRITEQAAQLQEETIANLKREVQTTRRQIDELTRMATESIAEAKRDIVEEKKRRLQEYYEEIDRTKKMTEREMEVFAKAKIDALKNEFDLTISEEARLKREFKRRLHDENIKIQKKSIQATLELSKAQKEAAQILAKAKKGSAQIKATEKGKTAIAKHKLDEAFRIAHAKSLQQERLEEERTKIRTQFDEVANLLNDGKTVRNIAITTGLTIAAVLAVRHMLPIVRKIIEDRLFTPTLIEDSSSTGFAGYFSKKSTPDQKITNLYFNEKLKEQVDRIVSVLKNTSANKGYYLNYLFYGEPGTGKTATARALAYESGMDYAIMSGGNIQKLLASGKAEEKLKDVFKWAKNSKKGMILFIDEADAFLKDPNKYAMTDELYAVLNSFLNMTGTESKDITIIMSTNHPQNLPKAVIDRVGPGQFIYFGLPEYKERLRIVSHFLDKYLGQYFIKDIDGDSIEEVDTKLKDEITEYIAQKTDGFSGRNISYLILAIEKALLAKGVDQITKKLIERMVDDAVEQQTAAQEFTAFA